MKKHHQGIVVLVSALTSAIVAFGRESHAQQQFFPGQACVPELGSGYASFGQVAAGSGVPASNISNVNTLRLHCPLYETNAYFPRDVYVTGISVIDQSTVGAVTATACLNFDEAVVASCGGSADSTGTATTGPAFLNPTAFSVPSGWFDFAHYAFFLVTLPPRQGTGPASAVKGFFY